MSRRTRRPIGCRPLPMYLARGFLATQTTHPPPCILETAGHRSHPRATHHRTCNIKLPPLAVQGNTSRLRRLKLNSLEAGRSCCRRLFTTEDPSHQPHLPPFLVAAPRKPAGAPAGGEHEPSTKMVPARLWAMVPHHNDADLSARAATAPKRNKPSERSSSGYVSGLGTSSTHEVALRLVWLHCF